MAPVRLHATCVRVLGLGVLLVGASGTGKSDLALRLIDRGAELVADDQVIISRDRSDLIARPPENFGGMLEINGVGIFQLPFQAETILALAVVLKKADEIVRLPEPGHTDLLNLTLPELAINPWEISASIKVEMAVKALKDGIMKVGAFRE